MYIVFEGIDTSGKTTQIELLKPLFPHAIFTREPGGSRIGEKIRKMILEQEGLNPTAEFFLFLADRAQHISEVILPHKKDLIIADRSFVSGIAYAEDLFPEAYELNLFAMQGLLPDKVIVFKIDQEDLCKRLKNKHNDVIEKRGMDYLLRVQENLLSITKRLEKERGVERLVLDAGKNPRDLHQEILKALPCDA
ncbi:dTMP kinase [Helicobacter mustelae]|uniref:Thymidylate kinase n=1 Tax=Helicobacter mustelae (strain ATCC 43772 / CCUG 25715 / CIP 103759 / LMG 18044 / NCTC 12198 / R85-136P) TaxID=679897 RepID=D3UGB9_HELM1|nr:dTMP kinase [Helicobacter mustelae]CBG39540.1 putative thymidylate kinase [Helicobacter mustelae 12198]SQH71052.1 thymidylate kinase [Helicobacter mustelae]